MALGSRLQHAWNAFMNKDPTSYPSSGGYSYSYRPDRPRLLYGNDRSIVTSVITRIAIDCSQIAVKHVKLDDNGRFLEEINDGINNCLNLEANIDQTGRALIQDSVMSMLDEGVVALVPVDVNVDPTKNNSIDVETMRTAKILEWYPEHVRLRLYNDRTGTKEEIILPKKTVYIIENPLFSIMNEPNSTMQRLIRKLNLLDVIDEQSGSGKLDLIIQLPYSVRTDGKRQQAEQRRKDIEDQLTGTKYGIAYIDSTEHITQLNRAVENNLLKQVEYLTSMLYSQLGITAEIMNGTADANTMTNYYSRTIEPIMSAVVDEIKRKYLTKTARTQGQSIQFFRDPFKLIPVNELPEITDKFTRNEVLTSNEVRQIIGYKPSRDPNADELRNKNLSQAKSDITAQPLNDTDIDENQSVNDDLV